MDPVFCAPGTAEAELQSELQNDLAVIFADQTANSVFPFPFRLIERQVGPHHKMGLVFSRPKSGNAGAERTVQPFLDFRQNTGKKFLSIHGIRMR